MCNFGIILICTSNSIDCKHLLLNEQNILTQSTQEYIDWNVYINLRYQQDFRLTWTLLFGVFDGSVSLEIARCRRSI